RVLTAPAGFVPKVTIRKGGVNEERDLPADDAFLKSILHFASCVGDTAVREENYLTIVRQAKLVDEFRALAEKRS
ncbi:MAG: gfo/Idh/MocA family oxidoreductase, partial [Christensenellaceae bacterium]